MVKYSVLFYANRNYIVQHGENCVMPVFLLGTGTKYRRFGLPRRKKTSVFTAFFAPRVSKICESTAYLPIFRGQE